MDEAKTSLFQTGVLIAFTILILLAVAIFAGWLPIGRSADSDFLGNVTVWGPWSSGETQELFHRINQQNGGRVNMNYVAKIGPALERDYVQARIQGGGPDLIIVDDTWLVRYGDTFWLTDYTNYPERNFRNNFIDGAGIFLTAQGVLARPLVVDPLVMYYNRDLYNESGVGAPPRTWTELIDGPAGSPSILSRLNIVVDRLTVTQSALALGEFGNIRRAKDVTAAIFLQVGDRLIERSGEGFIVPLGQTPAGRARSALEFYVRFSNPNRFEYSWNRTLPTDREMFLSGRLANYFDFSSELSSLRRGNPNLDIDVQTIPQNDSVPGSATVGRIYAVAVNRNTTNPQAAFVAAGILSDSRYSELWEGATGLPTTHRQRLDRGSDDPFMNVFYRSALITKTWYDPDPARTSDIFQNMIESVSTGSRTAVESLNTARQQLINLLN